MRRREFITLMASAAGPWSLPAQAQQTAVPLIGYFSSRSPESEAPLLPAFRRGLADAGYVENQNVRIKFQFSRGHDDRLPSIAGDLVSRKPALLVASDGPSAVAAKAATSTIPIVFSSGPDPERAGLVDRLNRPGGNATGISIFTTGLGPKRLEILRELVPSAALIAFVVNPDNASTRAQVEEVTAAAKAVGQQIVVLTAGTEQQIDQVFQSIAQRKVNAILYGTTLFFQVHMQKLVELAARHSVPAMYEWREFVAAGGLASYSPSRPELYLQLGAYAGRILKGEKPADLPVVQPTKFELVINLKTAKALGLPISPTLLATADELIQ